MSKPLVCLLLALGLGVVLYTALERFTSARPASLRCERLYPRDDTRTPACLKALRERRLPPAV